MAEPVSDAQRIFVLGRLSRAKGGRASASELRKLLSGSEARKSGFDDGGVSADRTLGNLIAEGLIKEVGGARNTNEEAPHPHTRSVYLLTEKGDEQAKPASRPPKPDHSEQLLARQKAFILLQFFRAEDEGRALARSVLNAKLKTKTARETLELDSPTIAYDLFTLVEQGYLTERKQGSGAIYEPTDDGLQFLAATEQYETARFTLTGAQLNALLAAVRESGSGGVELTEPTSVTPTGGEETVPSPPSDSPALDDNAVLRIVESLRRGEFAHTRLIPIHEVRRRVAREFGPGAAGHEVFDAILSRLHSEGLLDMIAISDLRKATRDQLADSIEGVNETLFYLVSDHEPSRV
jgi:DNA-binding PadR family transcriptional regulator